MINWLFVNVRFCFRWCRYQLSASYRDEVNQMVKIHNQMERMMSSQKPLVLRDDLVCMKCSKDLPAMDLSNGGGRVPFHLVIDSKTGEPTITCFECGTD